ncbi:MAG: class I SAM-dependent methyltransferase [Caulobacteraceae bacterium]
MLESLLQRAAKVGRLTLTSADGRVRDYGDGTGPHIAIRLKPGAALKLLLNADLQLGECYMNGDLILEHGDAYDLLEMIARNMASTSSTYDWATRAQFAIRRRLQQVNDRRASRRNVAHHYDLSYDLYRRFLDADMQYSCAYYAHPDASLEEAQAAKKAHLAAKLQIQPGHRVLDIGCGWGGLGLSLGEQAVGVEVLGVTLSQEQLTVARRRANARSLNDRVRFELCDYRDVQGPFDRIVSVGMFEHVGRPNYQAFFDRLADLLSDDGVAVIHSIGRRGEPGVTQPFIAKYIFPGGYIPAVSEVLPAVQRAGLWMTDLEILRLHYAETIREWRRRFAAERDAIASLYDQRFCRMWEFYLALSEIAFRWFGFMNFQIQVAKRVDALPIVRDYMRGDLTRPADALQVAAQ